MPNSDLDAPTQAPAAAPSGNSLTGEFAGYEILREIGRGGMGVVYLAKQISLERLVALKTIESSDTALAKLLSEEAKIVGKLSHPGIVPVYEANTTASPWFFTMGYIEGQELSKRIAKEVLSVDATIQLGGKLCDALTHAHEQGILHLDIKPANIMLDQDGEPSLMDFGLSAALSSSDGVGALGTPKFMPPEQALAERNDLCAASDIYSLGAVLYCCLCGRPPVVSGDNSDLILKIVSQKPAGLRQQGVSISRGFEAILMKCLEKEPRRRYASAEELKLDLIAFQQGEPIQAKPPSLLSQAFYYLKKHLLAASVSGLSAFVLLVLVGWVSMAYVTQSMELKQLQDSYETLRRNLNKGLSPAQKAELFDAVANDHFEAKRVSLAAEIAAQNLLDRAAGGGQPSEVQLSILKAYAEQEGLEWQPMEAFEFAKRLLTPENRPEREMAETTNSQLPEYEEQP